MARLTRIPMIVFVMASGLAAIGCENPDGLTSDPGVSVQPVAPDAGPDTLACQPPQITVREERVFVPGKSLWDHGQVRQRRSIESECEAVYALGWNDALDSLHETLDVSVEPLPIQGASWQVDAWQAGYDACMRKAESLHVRLGEARTRELVAAARDNRRVR